jgi:hypothetical protein
MTVDDQHNHASRRCQKVLKGATPADIGNP